MKKIIAALLTIISLSACNTDEVKGKFTLTADIKNIEDQKVYLDQIFFSEANPEVLDTAEIKAGKFTVSAIGGEQGLYRLRFEKQESGSYIFINDKSNISLKADVNDKNLNSTVFNSPANKALNDFSIAFTERNNALKSIGVEIDSLKKIKAKDSLLQAKIATYKTSGDSFKKFILKSIDSIDYPVVGMLLLGNTNGIDKAEVTPVVNKLAKRFPTHSGITALIKRFNEPPPPAPVATEQSAKPTNLVGVGSMAPQISMTDTSGKPFLLSSLRGKYVLVDFWASWCMPCRGENPNVVANYNKYKNKNFTVLGVSLDEDKAAWTKAIIKDKLSWKQVSDLKGWACAATTTYGFDAIPYNVLVDPSGKIIATNLREGELEMKLGEVLR
jgi:peroxiredoxin